MLAKCKKYEERLRSFGEPAEPAFIKYGKPIYQYLCHQFY